MPVNLNPSNSDPRKFKVAAVQAEPVWLDLQGSVKKTIHLIRDAAARGAKVIGLPEVFIPGALPPTPENADTESASDLPLLAKYQANSLAVHSPEMDRIREAVKELGVYVVLGFSERDGGSLYIAQVTIAGNGDIVNHRRKIKPTHYEKTIFGDGSGAPRPILARISCPSDKFRSDFSLQPNPFTMLCRLPTDVWARLIAGNTFRPVYSFFNSRKYNLHESGSCFCLPQPALKLHFFSQLPQIFVGAGGPPSRLVRAGAPYIVSGEASARMTQMVAMEGGCFGLTACHVVSAEGAKIMKMDKYPWFQFPGGGFTTIYGPDGSALTPPIDPGVEETAIAEISLDMIANVKIVADQMGNYSRHDLMHLVAHGKNWRPVEYSDEEEQKNLDTKIADVTNDGSFGALTI